MSSRIIRQDAQIVYERLIASGLDLRSTRRAILYWSQGLIDQMGVEAVHRLMSALVLRARSQRNPAAWFNWASKRPWTTIIPDDQIRLIYNGKPEIRRRDDGSGALPLGDLIATALG
tara:strand:- start:191 stop:541 length:351 start_codon:yes stop_codon:yes gene_type:complete